MAVEPVTSHELLKFVVSRLQYTFPSPEGEGFYIPEGDIKTDDLSAVSNALKYAVWFSQVPSNVYEADTLAVNSFLSTGATVDKKQLILQSLGAAREILTGALDACPITDRAPTDLEVYFFYDFARRQGHGSIAEVEAEKTNVSPEKIADVIASKFPLINSTTPTIKNHNIILFCLSMRSAIPDQIEYNKQLSRYGLDESQINAIDSLYYKITTIARRFEDFASCNVLWVCNVSGNGLCSVHPSYIGTGEWRKYIDSGRKGLSPIEMRNSGLLALSKSRVLNDNTICDPSSTSDGSATPLLDTHSSASSVLSPRYKLPGGSLQPLPILQYHHDLPTTASGQPTLRDDSGTASRSHRRAQPSRLSSVMTPSPSATSYVQPPSNSPHATAAYDGIVPKTYKDFVAIVETDNLSKMASVSSLSSDDFALLTEFVNSVEKDSAATGDRFPPTTH